MNGTTQPKWAAGAIAAAIASSGGFLVLTTGVLVNTAVYGPPRTIIERPPVATTRERQSPTTTASSPPATTEPGGAPSLPAVDPATAQVPGGAEGPFPVTDVVDGDTIKIERNGRETTVRLIGIDTPETRDPREPVQCFGLEATRQGHALLDGRQVRLETDPTQGTTDRYGRTLAYVWLPDGQLYNLRMLIEGFAHEYTYRVPYKYQALFKAAESQARATEAGLWAQSHCD